MERTRRADEQGQEAARPVAAAPSPARVQRRLSVGASDDPAEREADRVAARVMRNLSLPAGGPGGAASPASTRIRRSAAVVGAAGGPVDAGLERRIGAARRGGAPLPGPVRERMSEGFGRSFDDVRVHTDGNADRLNRELSASAFTLGNDVFFARDQFRPDSPGGQELIAHELAHTVQQGGGGDTAHRTIRRRWDINAVDPTAATRVKTISSGQAVFFLEDAAGDTVVAKGDNVPVGLNQLFAMIQSQVSGAASVITRDLGATGRARLKSAIASPAAANDPSWTRLHQSMTQLVEAQAAAASPANQALIGGAPTTPADKARLFHLEQVDGVPKIIVMTDATAGGNREIEKAAAPGAGGGQGGPPGGARTARALFGDPAHMEQLGVITAADLFLGNTDRVWAGNLGNWFVNAAGAITLIDNLDGQASGEMRSDPDVISQSVRMLRKSEMANTAATCIGSLVRGMKRAGDTTADEWAATLVRGTPRSAVMQAALLKGMKTGRARIVKLYATNKMSRSGREAKRAAEATQAQDVARGDQTVVDYWDTLKRRARYLQKN